MTVYFNPPKSIRTHGRHLRIANQNYDEAKKQLRPGEHLYAFCEGITMAYAPCVDSEAEFNRHFQLFAGGGLFKFELYALDEDWHARAQ